LAWTTEEVQEFGGFGWGAEHPGWA
jgi:hypothetical protein